MKYEKIIKWFLLVLFIIGAALSFYGFAALTIAAVFFGVVVIGGLNNPMSLLKLFIGLVVIAAIVAGAYFLAPGTPAVGYLGEPVSDNVLKLTDTILNLTYLLCGGAVLSLVVGAVLTTIKK